MDPTRYWMLTTRKLGEPKAPLFSSSNITVGSGGSSSTSYHESWEERAFAEDSAGHLGGCIWPPRSYSCSFCGREFRSAQALGGHMNVHRRDRARLKLAGVADDGVSDNQIVSPCQSHMIQSCPQIASLQHAYVTNPYDRSPEIKSDPLCSVLDDHPSRYLVQAAAAGNVWDNQVLSAPLASLPTWIDDSGKREVFRDAPQTFKNHARPAEKMCSNQELQVGSGGYKLSTLGCWTRRDFREGSEDEHSVHVGCKRRRIDLETSPLIPCSFSRKHQQDEEDNGEKQPNDPKVLKLCPSSQVEELDLELRLGVSPKVK